MDNREGGSEKERHRARKEGQALGTVVSSARVRAEPIMERWTTEWGNTAGNGTTEIVEKNLRGGGPPDNHGGGPRYHVSGNHGHIKMIQKWVREWLKRATK